MPTAEYTPSPAEIEQACLRIQQGWSDEERVRRQHMRMSKLQSDGESIEELARERLDYTLSVRRRRSRRAG